MKLGKKSTKITNNEAEYKNQPKLFKPNIFKSLEKPLAFNKKNLDTFTKSQ